MQRVNPSRREDSTNTKTSKYGRLSIYNDPPDADIWLEDVETLVTRRIQLLKSIDDIKMNHYNEGEYNHRMRTTSERYFPLHSDFVGDTFNIEKERVEDRASHFFLRLGVCTNDGYRHWFVNNECSLFKYRFSNTTSEERQEFLDDVLPFLAVTNGAGKTREKLEDFYTTDDVREVFMVPFELVEDLITNKSVFLAKGIAYVPRSMSHSIVSSIFRLFLEANLMNYMKELPSTGEGERLMGIIERLCKTIGEEALQTASGGVFPTGLEHTRIDKIYLKFPPCMLHLHTKLSENSHLKYGGRTQYSLFLQSIGLSLSESVLFWKKKFRRKIGEDQFNKNYLYNIRYNYGMEGRRVSCSPQSCYKIINSNHPGQGDHHGCPFKHFDKNALGKFLGSFLDAEQAADIMQLNEKNYHQLACTRFMVSLHKIEGHVEPITHPHKFVDQHSLLED